MESCYATQVERGIPVHKFPLSLQASGTCSVNLLLYLSVGSCSQLLEMAKESNFLFILRSPLF